METTRFGALWRAAVALGRRRRLTEGEEADAEGTDESGFTLIELMVVLLIMGILMAIAIPTFLGVTSTANDTSTQSNLTNTLTAAKAIYARNNGWPVATTLISDLTTEEPEFTYGTASAVQKDVAVSVTGTTLVLAAYMTKTHVCWVVETKSASVTYAGDVQTTAGTCTASATLVKTTGTKDKSGTKWPTIPGH